MMQRGNILNTNFGDKLKKLRKDAGWSQNDLGSKIEIHGRHIGKYETGRALPNSETIMKIADVFKVSIDYLLKDEIKSNTDIQTKSMDKGLLQQFQELQNMTDEDKMIVCTLIDAFIKKKQVEKVISQ
jgi:transcriptional regulator with XRE-family HTH domain